MKKIFIILLVFVIFTIIYFQTNWIHNESTGLKDLKNYKLGDVVLDTEFNLYPIRIFYRNYFKNTIAGEYFKRTSESHDYETLYQIVKEWKSRCKILPSEDEAIFHIRAGDVIDWEYPDDIDDLLEGRKSYNYSKCGPKDYLLSYEKIIAKCKSLEKIKKITIVSGYHTNEDHTRSEVYLKKIKQFIEKNNFEVTMRINNNPDDDFVFMSNSKIFMKSGGGFSKLVSEMVKKNNNLVL